MTTQGHPYNHAQKYIIQSSLMSKLKEKPSSIMTKSFVLGY
jgi:hypothetical protein